MLKSWTSVRIVDVRVERRGEFEKRYIVRIGFSASEAIGERIAMYAMKQCEER